ncbi:MAG: hypothetical protein ABL898_06975 [Hyphomicrobiaceae bacterium]
MIHVAAADEYRGRIIVTITGDSADDRAVVAAGDLATIFGSTIEGLYIENTELFQAAAHSFTRQVLLSGQIAPTLDAENLASAVFCIGRKALRQFSQSLVKNGMNSTTRSLRVSIDVALATACTEQGPWNIAVIGNAISVAELPKYIDLLTQTVGLAALWTVPKKSQTDRGPIVIIVDQDENLHPMLRFAERYRILDQANPIPITIMILANSIYDLDDREGRLRLALGTSTIESTHITIERSLTTAENTFDFQSTIRKQSPRLVIAQSHTLLTGSATDTSDFELDLPYQLLIVR